MPKHEVTSSFTVGVDVGDRHCHLCLLDTETGAVVEESRIATSPRAFERRFSDVGPMRVAIEAGTHSLWVRGILEGCGHEVLVANARKLRLIYADGRKNDRLDAENLARLARLDPCLLSPVEHRGETAQAHLALLRSREMVVRTRSKLFNHVRTTIRPHWQLACCAFSFCWWAYGRLPTDDEPSERPGDDLPAGSAGRGKKETPGAPAGGLEGGEAVAGTVGDAVALLEGVLRQAPATGAKSAA